MPEQLMPSYGLAEKLVLTVGRLRTARQHTLQPAPYTALERWRRLQIMHHAQCHGLVALLLQRQRQAARCQLQPLIELRRQRNTGAGIARQLLAGKSLKRSMSESLR